MICNNIYSLDSTSNHISLLMNLNFNVSQIVKIKLFNIRTKTSITNVMYFSSDANFVKPHKNCDSIYSLTIASYL